MKTKDKFAQHLSAGKAFKLWEKGRGFNDRLKLDEEVNDNENFFIGK